jgi:hypothetical protein
MILSMNKRNYFQKMPLEEVLIKNSPWVSTNHLKRRLIREAILQNCCAICGINEWQGRPLVLHLDHTNGDRQDNRLENLRLLCPNCHSQTTTYCGKKNRTQNHCLECASQICKRAVRCKSCTLKMRGMKINWPPIAELEALLCESSFLAVARQLGVSDNAIRKHMRRHANSVSKQIDADGGI